MDGTLIKRNERRSDSSEKSGGYGGVFIKYVFFIFLGFFFKSIFYMIGKECFETDKKLFIQFGNEAFVDIGNELFTVICILSALFAFGKIILIFKNEFLTSIGINGKNSDQMNRKQANCLFIISVMAFVIGFVLIVISVVLISVRGGDVLNFLLVLGGIISEITAIGFLVVYHKTIAHIIYLHKLSTKKELFTQLINVTKELQDNREEMMIKIIEGIMKDFDDETRQVTQKSGSEESSRSSRMDSPEPAV